VVVGGDSQPQQSRVGTAAADSSDEDDAAATYIEKERLSREDPGDRAVPLEREEGDPWAPGLNDIQRAARLEGRKIVIDGLFSGELFKSLYLIGRYRRFIPNRGSDGRGFLQFWGPRATKRWYPGKESEPAWKEVEPRKLHTVAVGEIKFRS